MIKRRGNKKGLVYDVPTLALSREQVEARWGKAPRASQTALYQWLLERRERRLQEMEEARAKHHYIRRSPYAREAA